MFFVSFRISFPLLHTCKTRRKITSAPYPTLLTQIVIGRIFSEGLCQGKSVSEKSGLRTRGNKLEGDKINDFRLWPRRRRKIVGCICVLTHTFPLFLNDLGASCGAVSWLISLSKLYSAYITKTTHALQVGGSKFRKYWQRKKEVLF